MSERPNPLSITRVIRSIAPDGLAGAL